MKKEIYEDYDDIFFLIEFMNENFCKIGQQMTSVQCFWKNRGFTLNAKCIQGKFGSDER